MAYLNGAVVILTGNLGQDAVLKSLPDGKWALNFSLPLDVGTKADPRTLWIRCSLYGERGEKLVEFLTKGTLVQVVAYGIKLDAWKDRNSDEARASLSLIVQDIDLLGRSKHDTPSAEDEGEIA
jgi:single-strand DNA-binding protein